MRNRTGIVKHNKAADEVQPHRRRLHFGYLLFGGGHARGDDRHCDCEGGETDGETDVAVPRESVGNVAEEGAGGNDGDVGQLCRYVVEVVALCARRGEDGGVGDGRGMVTADRA